MSQQLSLFAPPPRTFAPASWSRGLVTDDMRKGYVHIIRGPDDPERLAREERNALGLRDIAPHRTVSKTPVRDWKRLIREHLKSQKEPITFNRCMVELAGVTADIAFRSNADAALWELVEDCVLEHTVEAPIFFRIVDPCMLGDGSFDQLDGDGWRRCLWCYELMPWNSHLAEQTGPCACAILDDPEHVQEQLLARAAAERLQAQSPRRRYRCGVAWHQHWALQTSS